MGHTLITLFYLGLHLSHEIWGQEGILPKPSIWAAPGPVVPQGHSLSIFCKGPPGTTRFRLEQVHSSQMWHKENLQGFQDEAEFFLQNVTSSHAGSYVCQYERRSNWSERSDPLELVVTGVFKDKPILSAQPSPVVALGGSVTLRCHLPNTYDTFILSKGGESAFPPASIQEGQEEFLVSPVFRAHAGNYTCYGSVKASRHEWSAPSDLLEVVVTGVYKKPQLSALPGPAMTSHENRTLWCHSETWFDMFHLSQEGSANSTRHLRSQYRRGLFQANFTMGSGWKVHEDMYRCYGSLKSFPSLWSDPSEPLTVPGKGFFRVNVLRLSLGGVLLLILLGILGEAWLSRKDPQGAINRPVGYLAGIQSCDG